MALTQDNRFLSISSPLGKDELLLTSFEGNESLSGLFEFHIEVLSKNHSIAPQDIIAMPVTITIDNKLQRSFNGYISEFVYGEVKADNLRSYQLTMVPWLWFLKKTSNHRIFQNKSSKEIISQIFQERGFTDFDFRASGNSANREYCVQYNESDFDFISRLLEEDGITYYFEQKDGTHKLHVVDAQNAYQLCEETDLAYSKGNQPNTQINRWVHCYEFRKGQWSLNDYDFELPTKSQLKTTASTSEFANVKNYEHYEYEPYYDFAGIGELTKKRIEAEEAPMDTVEASSDCSSFYAGGKFNLQKHAVQQEQGEYVITSIRHRAKDGSYLSGHESESKYRNDFTCIPESVHFRPPLQRKKPRMRGPQSATVVGPKGEEIYIDKYGRIKVQFHWDREGERNESSSCFIRVMQPWAGAGWGTSFIPRIGMEVVVDFFDGDPDRPIVTGSVYNGDNKPPFESKTQSGVRTRSTKSGSKSNFNELRFDDGKGSEQIYIHAEHNMDTEIENNQTLKVDVNRTKTVGKNENSNIAKDREKTVGENQSESIGANKTISVGKNHEEDIGANKTENIGGDKSLSIGKSSSMDISDNCTTSVGQNMSLDVGKNLNKTIGKSYLLEAGDQITLKTGSASIIMKKSGDITIKGKNINLKGTGNIILKGSKISAN